MRIPGSTPTLPVIYRNYGHSKKALHTKSSRLWTSEENFQKELSRALTSMLTECFWPPLFQTNWISRRTNKSSEKLTSLSTFTLNIKQFLWKYHILPTLFRTALGLLRSKQRKCYRWKVYSPISPELNGAFCNCFATCKLAQTFILKLKCSAFIRNTSRPEKGTSKIEVLF